MVGPTFAYVSNYKEIKLPSLEDFPVGTKITVCGLTFEHRCETYEPEQYPEPSYIFLHYWHVLTRTKREE